MNKVKAKIPNILNDFRQAMAPRFLLLWSLLFILGYLSATLEPQRPQVILQELVIDKGPYLREEILEDYQNRISEDFTIPQGLRERVGFWFDIYTHYDSHKKVIHHTRYPWIIFKVVDISEIINSDTPKVRWLRNVKADKFVASELRSLREALRQIARRGQIDENNEEHLSLLKALEPLKGSLREKAKNALKNIRTQTGQKNFFAEGLEVSPLYLQGMEEIFSNHKLPVELTRLPFVESSFNKHAVSRVGASGIWQFMDYTGKNFMTVSEHIDERTSPFKATEAAALLLKENYQILGRSWPLAVTAWNHGPSGIRRALKATRTKELSDIIGSYNTRSFDFASSNFYSEFLAALYAEKYHEQIFKDLQYEKSLDLHTVTLARSVSAKNLLRRSGLAKEDFLMYNPDLKKAVARNAMVPKGFNIMVDGPARMALKILLTKETRSAKTTKVSQSDISYFKQE